MAADADVVRRLFEDHLRDLGYRRDAALDADIEHFPESYQRPGGAFIVACSASEGIVGMAGLLAGEIRRVHVRRGFRRHGLAQGMIRFLVEIAHEQGLVSVQAIIARNNLPSRRAFEACGFRRRDGRPPAPGAEHCDVFVCPLSTADDVASSP